MAIPEDLLPLFAEEIDPSQFPSWARQAIVLDRFHRMKLMTSEAAYLLDIGYYDFIALANDCHANPPYTEEELALEIEEMKSISGR